MKRGVRCAVSLSAMSLSAMLFPMIFLSAVLLPLVSTTAAAQRMTPEQQDALCRIQSTVRDLQASVSNSSGGVIVTWKRTNPANLLQYRLPPRPYPVETRVAMNADAKEKGMVIPPEWFRALSTPDLPRWQYYNVGPGTHTFSVAQKDECGRWNTKNVVLQIGPAKGPDAGGGKGQNGDSIEIPITAEEAEDLSPSANLGRYASCMFGKIDQGKAVLSVIRRTTKQFVIKFVTSPLKIAKHPICLIEATGGLNRPPDPDEGIMRCYPEMGDYGQCPSGWEAFYKSEDGTKALSRMGPGPAPTAEGRDDQARLSCLAVIYNKYQQYSRNLDLAFEDRDLINQGCNKAVPAGSR
jgi:hypothetical protein